ncbi:MAG: B12-binding domain-containing radical SAM protein [Candidatus Portnoybacteria bacterium]|nr:B12-binding domain-containing radical SAM protein [Candidatus Portnoybacteria bacterium]
MANVCLIYPRDTNLNFFPLGLGYVASFLKKNGHNVIFLDLTESDLSILQDERLRKVDIFGLSITTLQLKISEKIINILKQRYPEKPIMVGGIHPSFFKDKFFDEYNIDFIVYGEGEMTANELCCAIDKGVEDFSSIDGLVFKKDDQIIINKPRALIENLDDLPFPSRELVNYETYLQPPGLIRGIWTRRSANITTSRGCPGRCTYCGVNYIFNQQA